MNMVERSMGSVEDESSQKEDKNKQKFEEITEAIKNETKLYQKILLYQAVEFADVQALLKKNNIKCRKTLLREYLKERGVQIEKN